MYSNNTDFYGTDIKIDKKNRCLLFSENNDFRTISGVDNVAQAIDLRLNESVGRRLRLTTYGIRVTVGEAITNTAPIGYITASIQNTVIQDPRILVVTDLKFSGSGGGNELYIEFNAKTIDNNLHYQGVV